jgi:uncharacterized protein YndB with AHSA1/START domain
MRSLVAAAALLVASPATAEVIKSGEHGFELRYSATVPLEPAAAMRAFGDVEHWWSDDHSYSGDASNMSLALEPSGCFCERFPKGGGIEHLRVTYADPGKRVVLTGSLGPLLYEATTGVMDAQFKPAAGGSELTLSYKVSGFANGGAARMAPLVDQVLGAMMNRYRALASAPKP